MQQTPDQEALNLGRNLHRSGRLAEAEAVYRQILARQPNDPNALHLLGVLAHQMGQNPLAVTLIGRAISIYPQAAEFYGNIGVALLEMDRKDQALEAFQVAVRLQPDSADAHNNLGNGLLRQGRFDDAIDAYRRALELQPDMVETLINLGIAFKDQGDANQAIEYLRCVIALAPDNAGFHSELLYLMHFHPGFDAQAMAREHRVWSQRHADPLRPFILPHENDRNPDRRLRIGYISPDFYQQAECFFLLPLLENHDHENFEIHCYSSANRSDAITERIKTAADAWHEVQTLSDDVLANKIRSDQIDILIDLTMHMRANRLLVFARKPAPIQMSWLAYPGSTGLDAIDFRITDRFMEPDDRPFGYSAERPLRMPDSWCCYDPVLEAPAVSDLPARSTGQLTFGSFNNFCKMNQNVLDLWSRLLLSVAGSKLLLSSPQGQHRQRTLDDFAARGADAKRIEFVTPCPRPEYLQLYHRIDIGLDPFPYNGITTTCDALWMGVPVLSLAGAQPAGRAGLSLMSVAGIGDWVTENADAFVERAQRAAGDLSGLSSLRAALRENVKTSALMDAMRFARNLEAGYRAIWRGWCASDDRSRSP